MVNDKEHFKLPAVTPQLMSLVIKEIMERMTGEKKWFGNRYEIKKFFKVNLSVVSVGIIHGVH